ncbi:hypothetical protein LCGC14_0807980 [marine sediment metagenome]|uniref:Uncharacterized protein n=1 Tax=marine sediment metagenome TaxID=412755 RepID=A0A0F9PS82_9ZZZZ
MLTQKSYLTKEYKYKNYILNHSLDSDLNVLICNYKFSVNTLRIIANELRKPKQAKLTQTKGISLEPDLFD